MTAEIAIEAVDVFKDFGHVRALQGASVSVHRGEIVALVGDNGAGKSTLMKVMSGALVADAGELHVLGQRAEVISVRDAHALGIQTVYQDLALAPDLTVYENVFLGNEMISSGPGGRLGVLSRREMAASANEALRALGITLGSSSIRVSALSGGQRQAVAIARAVKWASSVILMDEPTAALGTRQTETVLSTIKAAAARGLGVLVVSHDMPRMLQVADRIVVLRHGRVTAEFAAKTTDIPTVVGAMLGSEVVSGS
jgi:simple sugar transport system ATP-binding protein